MLIPEGYILSNEISDLGKIHIANFSMFQKLVEDSNARNVTIKYGNCTFVNPDSPFLPNNFRNIIIKNRFTCMDNLVLTTYATQFLECTKKDLINMEHSLGEVKIQGKSFVKLDSNLVKSIRNKTITNINYKDYLECIANNSILGGVKLSKNNYMVWY